MYNLCVDVIVKLYRMNTFVFPWTVHGRRTSSMRNGARLVFHTSNGPYSHVREGSKAITTWNSLSIWWSRPWSTLTQNLLKSLQMCLSETIVTPLQFTLSHCCQNDTTKTQIVIILQEEKNCVKLFLKCCLINEMSSYIISKKSLKKNNYLGVTGTYAT